MNICLVSREFPPFVGGGIGSYTRRFASDLAADGHGVLVITVSGDGEVHDDTVGGVRVRRIPFIRGDDWSKPDPAVDSAMVRAAFRDLCPAAALSMLVCEELGRVAESFRPDVIEFPDTGALGWFTLNARRNGLIETAPIVVCVHSPSEWVDLHNRSAGTDRESRVLRLMEGDCLRWADGLVCPSASLAGWVERRQGLASGSIEPIPLVLGELAEEASEWDGSSRRVLFVGRQEPRKGIDLLLAAFNEAIVRGAELELDVVGADTIDSRTGQAFGRTALERLVGSEARERIRFHDRLAPEDVGALRREAVVCAVASPEDNFPYTCVEAMASGRPVLANRAGGMAEMVRDGVDGWLVSPTVSDWADALVGIAKTAPASLREMGMAARERIRDVCGRERVLARRLAHFRLAAGRRTTSGAHEVAMVNPRASEPAALRSLAKAAAHGGGVAIGWRRTPGEAWRIIASPTACAEWLCVVDAYDGAMAVETSALEAAIERGDARVVRVEGAAIDGYAVYVCEDVAGMLLGLLHAGVEARVVPEAIVDGSGGVRGLGLDPRLGEEDARRVGEALLLLEVQRRTPPTPPAPPPPPPAARNERAERAEDELRRIRASRGYALARRLAALARLAGLSRGS